MLRLFIGSRLVLEVICIFEMACNHFLCSESDPWNWSHNLIRVLKFLANESTVDLIIAPLFPLTHKATFPKLALRKSYFLSNKLKAWTLNEGGKND
jgi:hypothetical protein